MKTDEDSGKADEPPEEPPGRECRAKKLNGEENGNPQRAHRHGAEEPAHHTDLTIYCIDRHINSPGKERES